VLCPAKETYTDRCPKSQAALESRTMTGGGSAVQDRDLSSPSNGERAAPGMSSEPGAS